MGRRLQKCSLCGFEFDERETACARGCPLGKLCELTRCPSCGFEFPAERGLMRWLRGWFRPRASESAACEVLALPDLEEGQPSELVCLNGSSASRRNALAVYGVVPGCRILLQQKRPAYVIRVGETELAIEAAIAKEFLVRRIPGEAGEPEGP